MEDVTSYVKSKLTLKNLCKTAFMGAGVLGVTRLLKTDQTKGGLKNTAKRLTTVGAGIVAGATAHDFIAGYGWLAKHSHGGVVKSKGEAEESNL